MDKISKIVDAIVFSLGVAFMLSGVATSKITYMLLGGVLTFILIIYFTYVKETENEI